MEPNKGIEIKLQDLKKEENGKLTLFIHLEDLVAKNHQRSKVSLNYTLFDKYDSLVITPEDNIQGVKNKKTINIERVSGAFKAVQQMFAGG